MKVAITGASGHIGNCIVRALRKKGTEVKVLVHSFAYDFDELGVEIITGSLHNSESLEKLCAGVDVVIHLAAKIAIDNRQYEQVYATNVTGTENLLKAAKSADVKKFIHFSSIHAYQPQPIDEVLDETRPSIESDKIVYEYTKAESEKVVLKAAEEGMDAVIINPTAVIGPYDFRGSFLGQALRLIYRNKLPMLISGGYNWVDVRDVAEATLQAIEKGRKGEKYILSGNYSSLKELSALIAEVKGGRTPRLVAPVFLAHIGCPFFRLYASFTKTDPLYTHQSLEILANSPRKVSNEKARKELDYQPRLLKDTLTDTFEWYKENKLL